MVERVIGGSVETGLRVRSNTVECTKTTTCTAWRNNATFGPDTEVWARVATLPGTGNQFRLLRAAADRPARRPTAATCSRTNQLAGTDQVLLERIDAGAIVNRLTIAHELAAGDTVLLRVQGIDARGVAQAGIDVVAPRERRDSTYGAAGRVGIGIRGKTGRLDDFGAR